MIKKILVTSLLSASVLGASAGVSEASTNNTESQVHVYKQYGQVQIDQEQLNTFIQDILNKNNIQLDASIQDKLQKALNQGDAQQSEPQKEEPKAEDPKAEQPAPEQKADKPQVKQPEPKQEKAQEPAPKQEATPQPTQNTEQANKQEKTSEAGFQLTADEQQMLDLVNQERQKAGLAPLKADPELTKMARVKSQDMIDNNYFSHNSPTYGSPFDMMDQFGIEYQTAGENIAGNSSVQDAHTSLMNSDGHRKNILGSQYTKIGIGIVDGGPYGKMFTQAFTG